ncbi:MAG: hypothetical protein QXX01_01565 [Candidatus Aenigmatarchaeota archaeon]
MKIIKYFYNLLLIIFKKIRVIEIKFKREKNIKNNKINIEKNYISLIIPSKSFYFFMKKLMPQNNLNNTKIKLLITCDLFEEELETTQFTETDNYIKKEFPYFYTNSIKDYNEVDLFYLFLIERTNKIIESEMYKLFNLNFFEKIYKTNPIFSLDLYIYKKHEIKIYKKLKIKFYKKIAKIQYLPENKTIKILYFK